jgi:hypothetical protein
MLDQLMELMSLDDVLDVSLAADAEYDGCDDLLPPHLVQESFTSRESDDVDVNAGAFDGDNDDDECMDVDSSNHDCSEEWEECGEIDGQREGMTEDIQWDPVPFVPLESSSSFHDCHTGGNETRSSEPVDGAISRDSYVGASSLPPSSPATDGNDREIQWMPPTAAATTDERSLLSSSSRSLQPGELYARSRQRLVASMKRSQESRRHIQRRNQQQFLLTSSSRRPHLLSSSTVRGRSLGEVVRSEMISSFGRGFTDDDNTRRRPGLYSSSSYHNFAAV